VIETSKRHHRICAVRRPSGALALEAALAEGAPRHVESLGGWTQPGIFSWDRVDPGSALLLSLLPKLKGAGADLGCGIGLLGKAALASPGVSALSLIDIDRRAIDAAKRNISDPRARFQWADIRSPGVVPEGLDFIIMNPPFHDAGHETHALGQRFIAAASAGLRKGGSCWMVANRHLPYEAVLSGAFSAVTPRGDSGGYKVFEARR
jgi:16S rRNA (guanine1207-N2)-methyltransferase